MSEYVQAFLQNGACCQTAWIEKKKGVKEGCCVELPDGCWWTVRKLYRVIDGCFLQTRNQMDKHFGLSIKDRKSFKN